MPRKKTGLAEGVATAATPKRTRRSKAIDLASIFRLAPEQVADIEALIHETVTEFELPELAAPCAVAAVAQLKTALIGAARKRNRLERERLDALERQSPPPSLDQELAS